MAFLRRTFLVLLALIFSAGAVHAAVAGDKEFEIASKAFSDQFWENAEQDFGDYIRDNPKSPRTPEAILYQAEARFYIRQYTGAISLLSSNQSIAGGLGDLYLYWIAECHYQNTNYAAAAEAFGRMVRLFPDSTNRLKACVGEAASYAQLGEWNRTIELLQQPTGVFQQVSRTSPNDPSVALGDLLLGEAQLAQHHFSDGESTVGTLDRLNLNQELSWRRLYLMCRLQEAQGHLEQALATASNLVAAAEVMPQPKSEPEADVAINERGFSERFGQISIGAFRAQSLTFLARIHERLDHLDDAVGVYQQLAFTNSPSALKRRALLEIANLRLKQDRIGDAVQTLQNYLDQFPRSKASDVASLKLAELQLKQYLLAVSGGTNASSPALSNLLGQTLSRFDNLANTYSNSPIAGKAFLGKGWCLWLSGQYTQSETAFQQGAERASEPEDQAVARFKWADTRFKQGDFAGALTNYEFLVERYGTVPEVARELLEQALYQTVRCAFEVTNIISASNAMQRILRSYPDGFAADRGLLLTGEGYARQSNPSQAREYFSEFEKRFPTNSLLPDVRLAIARTYEQEKKWLEAIASYETWTNDFPRNSKLSQAEFYRAWDYFMAGQETNALSSFTNFVIRFPMDRLAQQAQWWIGSYYFDNADYLNAELNFQRVVNTNWPVSELNFTAQMMAGLAAAEQLHYADAIQYYFAPLATNTSCPADLSVQARFAWGDALMSRESTNKTGDLRQAIIVFVGVPETNAFGAKARGRVGDAYLQLGAHEPMLSSTNYGLSSNAYWTVTGMTNASVATRNQATIGLGVVAEAVAQQNTGVQQTTLLNQALADYQEVLFDDQADPLWRKDAGFRAADLAERMGLWAQSINVLEGMQKLLPELHATLESRKARAIRNRASQAAKLSQPFDRPAEGN